MRQDRQHNMIHGMGHVGYSRDCPLCPEGTMGLMAWNTWDVPGIVPQDRTYMAWHGTRGKLPASRPWGYSCLMSYKSLWLMDNKNPEDYCWQTWTRMV